MNSNKRILSIILALLLVFAGFPTTGLAKNTEYVITWIVEGDRPLIRTASEGVAAEIPEGANPADKSTLITGVIDGETGKPVNPGTNLIYRDTTYKVQYGTKVTSEFSLWGGLDWAGNNPDDNIGEVVPATTMTIDIDEFNRINEEYMEDYKVQKVSVGHFLVKALEQYAPKELEGTFKSELNKNYIDTLFGKSGVGTGGWMYYINDEYEGLGLKNAIVLDGDSTRFHNVVNYGNKWYGEFDKQDVKGISVDEKLSLKLTSKIFDMNTGATNSKPVDGADILARTYTVDENGKITLSKEEVNKGKTDAEGNVTISFDKPGDYYLISMKAYISGGKDYIPAYAKVSVEGKVVTEVDKTELIALIEKAESIDQSKYTDESVKHLNRELITARYVKNNKETTQAEVTTATKSLNSAIEKLVEKPEVIEVDKSKLQLEYSGVADKEQENYTDETWNAFLVAREAAKTIIDKENATQIEVNDALKNLQDAIAKLVEIVAWKGSGTEAEPYLIQNVDSLIALQKSVNTDGKKYDGVNFKLTDDITLPSDWTPIGNASNKRFTSTIDGDGHLLTIPKGGLPLLGYVNKAGVKNLNIFGEEIAGYGLVENYSTGTYDDAIDIDNVTLKSGSKTLKSGFIGGYASGSNTVRITNSKIEENVIIGYDKKQNNIGSFAGELNGFVENSISHATVYGVNWVGGLVGNKGQTIGSYSIENSGFHGDVIATGNYVGGISGGGYGGTQWGLGSAPNTPGVTIKNSKATGSITGGNYVGGILGAEAGQVQAWANGIGHIQGNEFTGTVTATNGEYIGGVIGYMKSLNKYNEISNNTYLGNSRVKRDLSGALQGIGHIDYIDTSYENPKQVEGTIYFDTSKGSSGVAGAGKLDHNRTDDPLGTDAEKLTKKIVTKAQTYEVTINTTPEDATVVVNKKGETETIAKTGEVYLLEAGDYTATVSADGYVEQKKDFTVVDKNENINIVLEAKAPWEGNGTEVDPYLIQNLDDMVKLQKSVNVDKKNNLNTFFKMTADIELPVDWLPIGRTAKTNYFAGNIDGDNHLLTIAKGGLPLLGVVEKASVKNLNIFGEEIAGHGLVENYSVGNYGAAAIDIDNVTLKSGSKTLKSGFIGGYASGSNTVNITNSTIEKDVIIGYDKNQSKIGSFGGDFNGTVKNSKSYATVYGINSVGGLVGNKGQSMGPCLIEDSSFEGDIIATGDRVGGILGSGYTAGSAPNTPAASVKNTKVTGSITGGNYVGGILGAEAGQVQAWANGIGHIQGNEFTGTVTATNGEYLGGIIGYMNSLNRHNQIENNTYLDTSGATKGIGGAKYIDTSYENPTQVEGVTYFDTSKGSPGIAGVARLDHNRTDDPLGTDAEKLTKKIVTKAQTYEVTINTTPEDATVVVNKKGETEAIAKIGEAYLLEAGDYTATVSAKGYVEQRKDFTVVDKNETVEVILESKIEKSPFVYTINPERTEVTITGYESKEVPVDLVIPEEIEGILVKHIGDRAFINTAVQTPLKSLVLPSSLETIGSLSFSGHDFSKLNIPAKLVSISEQAFFNSSQLESLTFADGSNLKSIGKNAFTAKPKSEKILKELILPEGLELIDERAFAGHKIEKLQLPESLLILRSGAFNQNMITEINIPVNIEKIGLDQNDKVGFGSFWYNTDLQGNLVLIKAYDESGKALPVNLPGVINPVSVNIEFKDEDGNDIASNPSVSAVGMEIEKPKADGTFEEGNKQYIKDYVIEKAVYNKLLTETFAKTVSENYFSKGNEYTFIAPEIDGYNTPESIVKTLDADNISIVFTYTSEKTEVNKDALNEVIALAEGKVETDHTPETWDPFASTLAEAKRVQSDVNVTQAQVDEAKTALKTAMDALKEKEVVNKDELVAAIARANGIDESKYTEDSVKAVKGALILANYVNGKADASQNDVTVALTGLVEALDGLVQKTEVNKGLLNDVIAEAEGKIESDYTTETWAPFAAALTEAKRVQGDVDTTQAEVDEAKTTLETAMNALVEKTTEVDKDALNEVIAEADGKIETDYTPESWTEFEGALENAKNVARDDNATEEAIENAKNALEDAINALVPVTPQPGVVDKTDLTNTIDRAKRVNKDKYTSSTVRRLEDAIESARSVLRDDNATQTEVNAAESELRRALNALEEIDNREPNYNGNLNWLIFGDGSENKKDEVKPETKPEVKPEMVDIVGHWAETVIKYVVEKEYFNGIDSTHFAPNQAATRGEFITVLGRLAKVDQSKYSDSKASDVNSSSFYSEYANWAISEGILSGYEDGTFRGDQTLTREEMAVFLNNTLKFMNRSLVETEVESFADEGNISEWAVESIKMMTANGYLKGRDGNAFDPKAELTRAEIAQIIYNVDTK